MRWWNNAPTKVDVIACGAHPDDIELLAGGSIAKACAEGAMVLGVDVTEAELSSNGTVASRKIETEKASTLLGLCGRVNFGLGDGNVAHESSLVDLLVERIRVHSPRVVLGPPDTCRHPDHAALNRALKDAVYFSGLKKYLPDIPLVKRPRLLKYFEVGSENPDFVIDISDHIETRRQAIAAYGTQFSWEPGQERTLINSGFLDTIERRLREWGERIGVAYGEPFYRDSPVRLNSLLD